MLASRLSFVVVLAVVSVAAPVAAASDPCATSSDFHNDGRDDLAIGVPGERLYGNPDAGAVAVVRGASSGFGADQFWHQDSAGIAGRVESYDGFGAAIATGDFNGDGYADIAIGAPDENQGSGVIHIIYGSSKGLSATAVRADQLISQESGDVRGGSEAGDAFGASLAAGDFNGDGRDDLAVGVPGESFSGKTNAGFVAILYGSAGGLRKTGSSWLAQGARGLAGTPGNGERFGQALASCDFDGDGKFDLAIGSSQGFSGAKDAGQVDVVFGSDPGGLVPGAKDRRLTQTHRESGDAFGSALAGGDFNGDGDGDLAVGVPGEGLDAGAGQGVVEVFMSAPKGPLSVRAVWHQDSPGIVGDGKPGEYFGYAVAAGDLDEDGRDDLAIGIPGDGGTKGAVAVLYSGANGPDAEGNRLYTQDTPYIPNASEPGDYWGSALTAANFNGDQADDLAIGAAEENLSGAIDAGMVTVIFGTADPAAKPFSVGITQDSPGMANLAEDDDLFGFALA